MSSWVSYHFEHLRRWREYAEKIAKAAESILGDVEVYVIGGVAEGRTTVLSDIDILVIAKRVSTDERKALYADILEKAIDEYGLPWDAPVELHIVDEREAREYLKRAGRSVRVRAV